MDKTAEGVPADPADAPGDTGAVERPASPKAPSETSSGSSFDMLEDNEEFKAEEGKENEKNDEEKRQRIEEWVGGQPRQEKGDAEAGASSWWGWWGWLSSNKKKVIEDDADPLDQPAGASKEDENSEEDTKEVASDQLPAEAADASGDASERQESAASPEKKERPTSAKIPAAGSHSLMLGKSGDMLAKLVLKRREERKQLRSLGRYHAAQIATRLKIAEDTVANGEGKDRQGEEQFEGAPEDEEASPETEHPNCGPRKHKKITEEVLSEYFDAVATIITSDERDEDNGEADEDDDEECDEDQEPDEDIDEECDEDQESDEDIDEACDEETDVSDEEFDVECECVIDEEYDTEDGSSVPSETESGRERADSTSLMLEKVERCLAAFSKMKEGRKQPKSPDEFQAAEEATGEEITEDTGANGEAKDRQGEEQFEGAPEDEEKSPKTEDINCGLSKQNNYLNRYFDAIETIPSEERDADNGEPDGDIDEECDEVQEPDEDVDEECDEETDVSDEEFDEECDEDNDVIDEEYDTEYDSSASSETESDSETDFDSDSEGEYDEEGGEEQGEDDGGEEEDEGEEDGGDSEDDGEEGEDDGEEGEDDQGEGKSRKEHTEECCLSGVDGSPAEEEVPQYSADYCRGDGKSCGQQHTELPQIIMIEQLVQPTETKSCEEPEESEEFVEQSEGIKSSVVELAEGNGTATTPALRECEHDRCEVCGNVILYVHDFESEDGDSDDDEDSLLPCECDDEPECECEYSEDDEEKEDEGRTDRQEEDENEEGNDKKVEDEEENNEREDSRDDEEQKGEDDGKQQVQQTRELHGIQKKEQVSGEKEIEGWRQSEWQGCKIEDEKINDKAKDGGYYCRKYVEHVIGGKCSFHQKHLIKARGLTHSEEEIVEQAKRHLRGLDVKLEFWLYHLRRDTNYRALMEKSVSWGLLEKTKKEIEDFCQRFASNLTEATLRDFRKQGEQDDRLFVDVILSQPHVLYQTHIVDHIGFQLALCTCRLFREGIPVCVDFNSRGSDIAEVWNQFAQIQKEINKESHIFRDYNLYKKVCARIQNIFYENRTKRIREKLELSKQMEALRRKEWEKEKLLREERQLQQKQRMEELKMQKLEEKLQKKKQEQVEKLNVILRKKRMAEELVRGLQRELNKSERDETKPSRSCPGEIPHDTDRLSPGVPVSDETTLNMAKQYLEILDFTLNIPRQVKASRKEVPGHQSDLKESERDEPKPSDHLSPDASALDKAHFERAKQYYNLVTTVRKCIVSRCGKNEMGEELPKDELGRKIRRPMAEAQTDGANRSCIRPEEIPHWWNRLSPGAPVLDETALAIAKQYLNALNSTLEYSRVVTLEHSRVVANGTGVELSGGELTKGPQKELKESEREEQKPSRIRSEEIARDTNRPSSGAPVPDETALKMAGQGLDRRMDAEQ